jgi:hypothetical protein
MYDNEEISAKFFHLLIPTNGARATPEYTPAMITMWTVLKLIKGHSLKTLGAIIQEPFLK